MGKTLALIITCWTLLIADIRAADPPDSKVVTVEVQATGLVDVSMPGDWTSDKTQARKTLPPILSVKSPESKVILQITFIPDLNDQFSTQEKIEAFVKKLGMRYVNVSVEKQVTVKELKSNLGPGAFAEFTDAKLVGKETVAGKYKVVATGMVQVGSSIATFTLLGDAFDQPEYVRAKEVLVSGIASRPLPPVESDKKAAEDTKK